MQLSRCRDVTHPQRDKRRVPHRDPGFPCSLDIFLRRRCDIKRRRRRRTPPTPSTTTDLPKKGRSWLPAIVVTQKRNAIHAILSALPIPFDTRARRVCAPLQIRPFWVRCGSGEVGLLGAARPNRFSVSDVLRRNHHNGVQEAFPMPRYKQARNRRQQLLDEDDRCQYCHKPITLDTSTLDHVVPLHAGGANENQTAEIRV